MNGANLSRCASAIYSILAEAAEAHTREAAFDGGEFSGPAIERVATAKVQRALGAHGYTAGSFLADLRARTSDRYVYFSCFEALEQLAEHCPCCGGALYGGDLVCLNSQCKESV